MAANNYPHPNRRWLTRRRFLTSAAAGGTGLTAAALIACGGSNDNGGAAKPAGSAAASVAATRAAPGASPIVAGASPAVAGGSPVAAVPRRGGELKASIDGGASFSIDTFDPEISLALAFLRWCAFGDKLVDQHPQTIEPIQPSLIESWEQPDPVTLNVSARQGVTYHEGKTPNGRAFDANDVAFGIMRMAAKFDPDRKARFQRSTLLPNLDKAEAVDNKTVKVSLTAPNSLFLNGLADFRQFPVAKEIVDKDPNFNDFTNLGATGAFVIQSFDRSTGETRFTANPKYWRTGLPYVATLHFIPASDISSLTAAFVSGQIHEVVSNTATMRKTIKSGRADTQFITWKFVDWDYLRLNQTKEIFKDVRTRQAIYLALDYKATEDINYGDGFWDYTGPLPAGMPGTWTSDQVRKMPGWNPDTKQADIANAKKLLEAAGYPNGKGMSWNMFGASATSDAAIPLQDQLQKAFPEMKVMLEPAVDSADFARRLGAGNYDVVLYTSFPAPSAVLEAVQHYKTGGGRNYTKFSDPDVDALIDKAFQQLDVNARNKTIGDLEQKLLDTIFAIPLCLPRYTLATDPKLHGMDSGGPGTASSTYDQATFARQVWFS